jgi:hypothetical protein
MMMGVFEYVGEKPKQPARIDPQVFDTYAGKYEFGNNRLYIVTREGNRYFGQSAGVPKHELFPATETRFVTPEFDAHFTFVKDEKGEVEMLSEQNGISIRRKKVKEGTGGSGQK